MAYYVVYVVFGESVICGRIKQQWVVFDLRFLSEIRRQCSCGAVFFYTLVNEWTHNITVETAPRTIRIGVL